MGNTLVLPENLEKKTKKPSSSTSGSSSEASTRVGTCAELPLLGAEDSARTTRNDTYSGDLPLLNADDSVRTTRVTVMKIPDAERQQPPAAASPQKKPPAGVEGAGAGALGPSPRRRGRPSKVEAPYYPKVRLKLRPPPAAAANPAAAKPVGRGVANGAREERTSSSPSSLPRTLGPFRTVGARASEEQLRLARDAPPRRRSERASVQRVYRA